VRPSTFLASERAGDHGLGHGGEVAQFLIPIVRLLRYSSSPGE
jgi:hypothetical protein